MPQHAHTDPRLVDSWVLKGQTFMLEQNCLICLMQADPAVAWTLGLSTISPFRLHTSCLLNGAKTRDSCQVQPTHPSAVRDRLAQCIPNASQHVGTGCNRQDHSAHS